MKSSHEINRFINHSMRGKSIKNLHACTLSIHIASITILTPAGGFAIDLTIVISGCFKVLSAAMAE